MRAPTCSARPKAKRPNAERPGQSRTPARPVSLVSWCRPCSLPRCQRACVPVLGSVRGACGAPPARPGSGSGGGFGFAVWVRPGRVGPPSLRSWSVRVNLNRTEAVGPLLVVRKYSIYSTFKLSPSRREKNILKGKREFKCVARLTREMW